MTTPNHCESCKCPPQTTARIVKHGDRVRTMSCATGRYLMKGWALCISAMDNSLMVSKVDWTAEPHPDLPVPSDDALAGALEAMAWARWKGLDLS